MDFLKSVFVPERRERRPEPERRGRTPEDVIGPHVDDYFPPSPKYEKPAQLLVRTEFGGVEISGGLDQPLGGVWRFTLKQSRVKENAYFSPNDFVRLRCKNAHASAMLGPFELSEPEEFTFELPFPISPSLSLELFAAARQGDDDVLVAHGYLPLPDDKEAGFKTTNTRQMTLNYRMGRVEPNAGIEFTFEAALVSIERKLDLVLTQILAHMANRRETIIFTEPVKSSLRLSLSSIANGEWWALSIQNEARENAGVSHCGAVKSGIVSGAGGDSSFNGKPLAHFLRSNNLCYMLPCVEDRVARFPNLQLKVIEFNSRSRRYSNEVKMLRLNILLDGVVLKPWYNFSTWDVAHPVGDHTQESEWDTYENTSEIRNALEDAMNKKAGLWVDVKNRLMVLFADEIVCDGVALRGMHHTMPISDEHLPHFRDVPEPTLIEFE